MKYRNAVFIVVYSKIKGKTEYLILKRKLHWKGWEFPKGGIEKSEKELSAVKRELKEETGLSAIKIKKFEEKGKYDYNKKLSDRKGIKGQKYRLYSAEVKKAKLKLDKLEHSGHKWLSFKEAYKKLKWSNQKKCLAVVNKSVIN